MGDYMVPSLPTCFVVNLHWFRESFVFRNKQNTGRFESFKLKFTQSRVNNEYNFNVEHKVMHKIQ